MPVMLIQRKNLMEPAYGICSVILVMVKNFARQSRKRSSEDAKMTKYNISMPDNAEGQRLNPVTGFE